MRVLGNATALLGAISLMGGIIVAQADYQRSWHENTIAQTPKAEVNEAFLADPGWLHQSCTSMKMTIG